MRAELRKTGEVVTLIDKRGDYFIDSNGSPYKEAELRFGVLDTDIKAPTDPMATLARMLQGNHQQMLMMPALTFATEVIKAKPNLTAKGVAEYVETVITELRKVL